MTLYSSSPKLDLYLFQPLKLKGLGGGGGGSAGDRETEGHRGNESHRYSKRGLEVFKREGKGEIREERG